MISGVLQNARVLLGAHSPAILTAVGVGGTIATAYLSGRASFKAAEIIENNSYEMHSAQEDGGNFVAMKVPINLSKTEKVQLVWREYLPPVAVGVLTVTCIIAANRISSRKIAALAIAGGISERALQEYKDKVIEKLGPRQDQKIRDEVAQDRVTNNPGNSREILVGGGEVLCYDMLTGRYFNSTMEKIRKAENRINYELLHHMAASLSMFYEEIDVPPTTYTDQVGWSADNMVEVKFSTVLSDDNRPCIAIDFLRNPVPDYNRHYN